MPLAYMLVVGQWDNATRSFATFNKNKYSIYEDRVAMTHHDSMALTNPGAAMRATSPRI
jgi:hypothetical protein